MAIADQVCIAPERERRLSCVLFLVVWRPDVESGRVRVWIVLSRMGASEEGESRVVVYLGILEMSCCPVYT